MNGSGKMWVGGGGGSVIITKPEESLRMIHDIIYGNSSERTGGVQSGGGDGPLPPLLEEYLQGFDQKSVFSPRP